MNARILPTLGTATLVALAACGPRERDTAAAADHPTLTAGTLYTVKDTVVVTTFDAAGTAEPIRQATLSTKLMGTVTAVLVKEGDLVTAGEPLVRIDARDLAAKAQQASAAVSEAEAVHADAETQLRRIRALYADSAATRAQLDAAETGFARATAGMAAARGAAAELGAVADYAVVRAPFAGVVTRRMVDPGAFAAPGAPLVEVQDQSQLRVSASTTPDLATTIRRGSPVTVTVEGRSLVATVEGVVPTAGNLYTINAIVPNAKRDLLAGATATIAVPTGRGASLLVPTAAVSREGDLTGVTLRTAQGDELRWIRLGRASAGMTEVTSGLRPGDVVVVPAGQVATMAGER